MIDLMLVSTGWNPETDEHQGHFFEHVSENPWFKNAQSEQKKKLGFNLTTESFCNYLQSV